MMRAHMLATVTGQLFDCLHAINSITVQSILLFFLSSANALYPKALATPHSSDILGISHLVTRTHSCKYTDNLARIIIKS